MKTKPYGVRFNEEDLELLKLECGVLSPQRAVNFLVQYWRETRFVSGSKVEKLATPVSGVISSQSSMGDVLVKKIEPSAVVEDVAPKVVEVVMDKQQKLSEFRGVIADVMGGDVSRDTFVFPDGLDEIKVDYKKLYDGCEFAEEYRGLWDRIKADDNLSTKEKNDWKLVLGAR